MDKPDNKFKLLYRELQKEYSQLKNEWLPIVWVHVQSVKADIPEAKDAIKHFLGIK